MAPNKRKILETARKYVQKGQKDRALKEFEKLLKLDPRDAKLRLEIGDAHRRWGQVEEAITAYTKVAEQYMAEGFDARAVAVFKQIQNLDPDRHASYISLAELYERMGLTAEAIQAYQTAADGYRRSGQKREALDLLRKMAGLDPSNTTSRIKVADLLRQEGMADEALAEYEAACAELEKHGELESAGTVLERILEVQPDHVSALTGLARNLLKRGFAERAEPFAKRALTLQAQETEPYELMAEVYRAQKRDDPLKETYRGLADLYRQRGDEDKARDILQRFVPVDEFAPDLDDDPGASGTFEAPPLGEPVQSLGGPALETEPLGGEPLLADDDLEAGEGDEELDLLELSEPVQDVVARPTTPSRPPPAAAAAPPLDGDPDQLLAEASVYLRYGKRDQALRNLEGVLAIDPEHRGALEKLGEAHAESGDRSAAVDAWRRAAAIAERDGDLEGVAVLRDRVSAVDPAAAADMGGAPAEEPLVDVSELEAAVEGSEPELPIDEDDVEIEIDDEGGIELEGADDVEGPDTAVDAPAFEPGADVAAELDIDLDLDVGEPDDVAEEPAAASASARAGSSASISQQVEEELEEAEFYHQQELFDEARAIYERVLEKAPNHPLALVRLGEILAQDAPARDAEPAAAPPDAGAAGEELADWGGDDLDAASIGLDGDAAGEPAADEAEVEVDFDLDEPDEHDALVADAAPSVMEPEPSDDTTDPEVPAPAAPAPEPAADLDITAPDAPESGAPLGADFDLAAELSEALDDEPGASASQGAPSDDGFAAVFREFKKGVKESLDESDHEAHWDLGIAYREMGLLEDAIGEFQTASHSPARRLDALHLIGVCAFELGRGQEAVGQLQEALATAGLSQEQELALRFDLGRAHEVAGQLAEARTAWEAVAAVDADFCEVGERLARLGDPNGETKPDSEPAREEFESFGDLIEETREPEAPAAAAPAHEDFQDLIAEVEQEPEPAAKPARAAPDPGDSGSDGAGDSGSGDTASGRPRRKKKISFV